METIQGKNISINQTGFRYRVWDETWKRYLKNPYLAANGRVWSSINKVDRFHELELELCIGETEKGYPIYVGDVIEFKGDDDRYVVGYEFSDGPNITGPNDFTEGIIQRLTIDDCAAAEVLTDIHEYKKSREMISGGN